ncbi:cytochrome ubiquinol oxidase subunit I [Sediminitomix flava]|uniref:Cytochrome bd-I ubiquinol oxidase subunit 1 apoprotein n=1 Tax=Sediminitomix flava TaxID=379075 RepID=A0A315Z8J4_SEDFL|nr:cytochrome ubiquinol oxidase subunit I [Sediminitomix flava]PWJ40759.1 cytochrome bd-I ubiquinol oxidase subunit 1 apoprotein [Sediminitomix flava]
MDVEILSRIQFAFTIMFHYIYPPFSIGLGLIMVICEGMYLKTDEKVYENMARFWTKIFATTFSIGVATGIVMEFEFGTNWATYSRYVGDIFGSPLAAEGIFAFFLESGFLAVLLFGWNRVSKRTHFFSTCMVALGSTMSAFWIVVANSWMQTPTAYEIVGTGLEARAEITDFWAMVFNPSSLIRFAHTVNGAFVQGAFLVISISAYYIIKNRHLDLAYKSIKIALGVALVASLLQPVLGHEHANVVAEYQPAKLAAYEGLYESTDHASMYVIGWTDPETEKTYGIEIPGMLSFLIAFDFDHKVPGLKEFPKEDWPNVNLVFQTYHIMVGLGMLFIALTAFSILALKRKNLHEKKWLIYILIFSVPLPVIANQAGWVSAEAGRQPWIVQDILRTSDALSKAVKAEEVLFSLIMFFCIYLLLFFAWIYILDKEIKHGPEDAVTSYSHRKERLDMFEDKDEE